jgi:beta-glucanase (GH16 family)
MNPMNTSASRSLLLCRAFLPLGGFLCLAAAPGSATVTAPPGFHLIWHDEFDGPEVDRTKWDFDAGTGYYVPAAEGKPGFWVNGWGNDELECYTDRHANAYVAGGALHIRAVKEDYKGGSYTSARLRTGGKGELPLFVHRYGRFEFRAKLPAGQGYWPALWLLPQDQAYGGWAASGEIDILENKGSQPDVVQGTIHFGGSYPKNAWWGQEYRLPKGGTATDWHVYALDWEPGRLRWSVDGVVFATRDVWWSKTGDAANRWPAPFDKPFYIVMNLAVGGRFGGNPDATTKFPGEMLVDYVRVFDRDGGPGDVAPIGHGSATDGSLVRPPASR